MDRIEKSDTDWFLVRDESKNIVVREDMLGDVMAELQTLGAGADTVIPVGRASLDMGGKRLSGEPCAEYVMGSFEIEVRANDHILVYRTLSESRERSFVPSGRKYKSVETPWVTLILSPDSADELEELMFYDLDDALELANEFYGAANRKIADSN